ncbi:MAG: hypothetical protein ACR2IE_06830 [Candidatus Sumerlaeaceae bacterium]
MKSLRQIFAIAGLLCAASVSLAEVGQVTFSYQGRVKVQGQAYNGTGQFKFAILNTSATTTLWSNDGTSVNGSQPSAGINLTVADGVFNVIVGDAALGMSAINSAIFQSQTSLKLRIWFNDGTNGFQQLNPDHNLVNLALTTIQTSEQDFTIYVNGTTGNDANNGLSASTAKKTIQGGVDIVPDRLNCNVTIKIAAGIYKETVSVYGISSSGTAYDQGIDGDYLRILGDETWTTTSVGSPNVRILGSDVDSVGAPRLRRFCISAHNCSAVQFEGLSIENAAGSGAKVETGAYIFKNCRASNNSFAGFGILQGAFGNTYSCEATGNANGIYMANGILYLSGCRTNSNTANGVAIQGPGYAQVYSGCISNSNTGGNGFAVRDNGSIGISAGTVAQSNSRYGLEVVTGSTAVGASTANFSPNTLGTVGTSSGGASY